MLASTDLDDAQSLVSQAYLPSTFTSPVRAPTFDVRLNVIKIGRITAGYLRFGDAMRIRTTEAANYHVDIPTSGSAAMRSGPEPPVYATRSTAAVFMPGRPADLDCDRDCAQICLMFPSEELHTELENLLGVPAARRLEFSRPMDLTTSVGATFIQTLRLIDLASASDNYLLEHPLAALRLEQVLMLTLLLTQPNNYSAALDKPPKATESAAAAFPITGCKVTTTPSSGSGPHQATVRRKWILHTVPADLGRVRPPHLRVCGR